MCFLCGRTTGLRKRPWKFWSFDPTEPWQRVDHGRHVHDPKINSEHSKTLIYLYFLLEFLVDKLFSRRMFSMSLNVPASLQLLIYYTYSLALLASETLPLDVYII